MKPVISQEEVPFDRSTELVGFINKPIMVKELSSLVYDIIQHKNDKQAISKILTKKNLIQSRNNLNDNNSISKNLGFSSSQPCSSRNSFSERNKQWPADCKILLVEDNLVNQEIIIGILESSMLTVEIANNGQQAIEKILHSKNNSAYSLVIMDCQMPVLDGYQATRRIRAGIAGESNQSIPIIAMTANAMEGDKEKCFDAGMDDYLAKPIEAEDFYQCLDRWLKEKPRFNNDKNLILSGKGNEAEKEKIWNRAAALKRMMNKNSLLNKIATLYVKNTTNTIDLLKKSIEDNDQKNIRDLSHTIKGVAANIGAEILAKRAFQIEQAAKSGELNPIPDIFDALQADHEQLLELLSEYLTAEKLKQENN